MRQSCRGVTSPQDGESFKVMAGRWHGREPVNATGGPFDVPTPRGLLQGVVSHARFLSLFHSHVPVLVSCNLPECIPTSHVTTVTQRHCSDRNSRVTSSQEPTTRRTSEHRRTGWRGYPNPKTATRMLSDSWCPRQPVAVE